jgi:shikimate kinase
VVLLGFMCSGKSTVAKALARRLQWDFVDFDVEIERREQRTIARLIEQRGEAYFRQLEMELTDEVAGQHALVVAPGGGWITNPGAFESLRAGSFTAWLQVSPAETVRRLREDPTDRPFKNHPDPIPAIQELLALREPLYRLADLAVPTVSRSSEEIAFELEQLIRIRSRGIL